MVPKLVAEDIPLLFSLLSDVFPGIEYSRAQMTALKHHIRDVCREQYLICGEGEEQGAHWMEKVRRKKVNMSGRGKGGKSQGKSKSRSSSGMCAGGSTSSVGGGEGRGPLDGKGEEKEDQCLVVVREVK